MNKGKTLCEVFAIEPRKLTGKQVRALLRTPKPVFGWVNTSADDGAYIQLVKSSACLAFPSNDPIYEVKDREDGIYIN